VEEGGRRESEGNVTVEETHREVQLSDGEIKDFDERNKEDTNKWKYPMSMD